MAYTVIFSTGLYITLAEGLGGTEDNFASMMTAKARALGMRGTVFRNASGLPDSGQVTTARDMAVLGLALRQRFPQYYTYFSVTSFNYRGRTIRGQWSTSKSRWLRTFLKWATSFSRLDALQTMIQFFESRPTITSSITPPASLQTRLYRAWPMSHLE